MGTRIPEEWRVPVAFVVLWVVPLLVADSLLVLTHGRVAVVAVALSLLLALAGAQALLRRSHVAWWLLVVLFVAGVAEWVYHVATHGLGDQWTLWGVLTFVNFGLLVSAPMRRFVRLGGRLAPGPR